MPFPSTFNLLPSRPRALRQDELDALLERGLKGEHSVLVDLHASLLDERCDVNLTDILQVISHFLSKPYLARARRMLVKSKRNPAVLAVHPISTGILALQIALDVFITANYDNNSPLFDAVINIVPAVAMWSATLLHFLPILNDDLIVLLCSVLSALHFSTPPIVAEVVREQLPLTTPAILDVYLHLSKLDISKSLSLQEIYHDIVPAFLFHTARLNEQPNRGTRAALETRSTALAETLLRDYIAVVGDVRGRVMQLHRHTSLICALYVVYHASPSIRRAMTCNGLLQALCRSIHRTSRLEFDKPGDWLSIVNLLWRTITILSGLLSGPEAVIQALKGRILSSVLRMQSVVYRCAATSQDRSLAQNIGIYILGLMRRLEAFLIFPSCHRMFAKAIRYVNRKLIAKGKVCLEGAIFEAFLGLCRTFEIRVEERYLYRSNVICTNPSCQMKEIMSIKALPRRGRQCTGCLTSEYCSKECQVIHWKEGGHREHCKRIQRGRLARLSIVPKSPYDMDMIHTLVSFDLWRNVGKIKTLMDQAMATQGVDMTSAGTNSLSLDDRGENISSLDHISAIAIDYGDPNGPEIRVDSLYNIHQTDRFMWNNLDFDEVQWMETLKLRQSGWNIVVMVDSTLVDLTDMGSLWNRVYPVELFM